MKAAVGWGYLMECDDFVVRKTLSYFKKNIKSESQETNSI